MKNLKSQKGDYLTDRLTDEAIKWIDKKKDQPFFLYMSHFAVHDPIQGRSDLVKKYEKKLTQTTTSDSADFILEGNPDNPDNPTSVELNELIQTREFARHKVLPRGTIKIKQKQDNPEFADYRYAAYGSKGQEYGWVMFPQPGPQWPFICEA